MRGLIVVGLSVFLAAASTARADFHEAERARLVAHFDEVLAELSAADTSALTRVQRARRAQHLAWLAEYRDGGVFPRRYGGPEGLVPEFRDVHGTRCAMGELLHRSGAGALVDDVAANANSATIAELSADPRLTRWLDDNGLSVTEAARIQPGYASRPAGCLCFAPGRSLWTGVVEHDADAPAPAGGYDVSVRLLERVAGSDERTVDERATVNVRDAMLRADPLLVTFTESGARGFPTDAERGTVACSTEASTEGPYPGWTTCRANHPVALDVAIVALHLRSDECWDVLGAEAPGMVRECGDGLICSVHPGERAVDERRAGVWCMLGGVVAAVLVRRRRRHLDPRSSQGTRGRD